DAGVGDERCEFIIYRGARAKRASPPINCCAQTILSRRTASCPSLRSTSLRSMTRRHGERSQFARPSRRVDETHMNPAFSVIFLTTFTGAAQGLLIALFGVDLMTRFGLAPPVDSRFLAIGCAIVVVLGTLGLIASFFHLGHP